MVEQKLASFLALHGISNLTSPPHTPEHNGYSERRHRHIVETILALLTHTAMPLMYWPYAFQTAVYLINRMPTSTLANIFPYEKLFRSQHVYHNLHNFGSLCYPWLRPYTSHKLEPRSIACVFVGYAPTQHSFLCLDPLNNRLYSSRHVKFVDNNYPFAQLSSTNQAPASNSLDEWCSFHLPTLQNVTAMSMPVPPNSDQIHSPTSLTTTTYSSPSTSTSTTSTHSLMYY